MPIFIGVQYLGFSGMLEDRLRIIFLIHRQRYKYFVAACCKIWKGRLKTKKSGFQTTFLHRPSWVLPITLFS